METKQAVKLPESLVQAVAHGRALFYGEMRHGVAVEFTGRGGKLLKQSKESVETPTGTITVANWLPDDCDVNKWVQPVPKGTMVYVLLAGLESTSGVLVASGKIVPV